MNDELKIGMEVHRLDCMIGRTTAYYARMNGFDEVTMMHGRIMRYLFDHQSKDVFQKDIEQAFSVGRSTVTNILQLMEKKGYICSQSVEHDARLKKVCLTEQGIAKHGEIESMIRRMDAMLLDGVEREELEVFFQVIHKIECNARKERNDDSDFITTRKGV